MDSGWIIGQRDESMAEPEKPEREVFVLRSRNALNRAAFPCGVSRPTEARCGHQKGRCPGRRQSQAGTFQREASARKSRRRYLQWVLDTRASNSNTKTRCLQSQGRYALPCLLVVHDWRSSDCLGGNRCPLPAKRADQNANGAP